MRRVPRWTCAFSLSFLLARSADAQRRTTSSKSISSWRPRRLSGRRTTSRKHFKTSWRNYRESTEVRSLSSSFRAFGTEFQHSVRARRSRDLAQARSSSSPPAETACSPGVRRNIARPNRRPHRLVPSLAPYPLYPLCNHHLAFLVCRLGLRTQAEERSQLALRGPGAAEISRRGSHCFPRQTAPAESSHFR